MVAYWYLAWEDPEGFFLSFFFLYLFSDRQIEIY